MTVTKKRVAAEASDPVAPKDPPRSSLEAGLERALAAYARHMLTRERAVPPFAARLDGPHVLVDVHAPDGLQHVRRRAGAYLQLCADIWGRSQAAAERAALPSLLATLSSHPDGGANEWSRFYDLEADADWYEGLEAVAEALVSGAPDEAVLLLRRLYDVDGRIGSDRGLYSRGLRKRTAPAAIARAVAARSAATPEGERLGGTPQAAIKRVVPFAGSESAVDRLAVASRICDALPNLSLSNHLTFHAIVDKALPALLQDGDGAVHEVALAAAQNLGMKLLYRGAYPEAKRLLDLVVAHHVALPESLRGRWECRLYLDACAGAADLDAAEEDWTRAATLDAPTDPSMVGRCMFWSGDVTDRRGVALARVAKALAVRAEGGDPCKDRKPGKPPGADERARLIARAAALSGDALATASPRIEQDLERARVEGTASGRGFQADEVAARAKVREAAGDLAGALADYEAARELSIAAGLSWQIDHHGEPIRRLRGRLGQAPAGAPESFDPPWLLDPARTSEERERAAASWFAQPWREFPATPRAAVGRPFAYVLLRDAVAHSAALWKIAETDGHDLGDRLAFAARALVVLDRWCDRRDASWLESVLDDSHELAFFGETCAIDKQPAQRREPLLLWLKQLVLADPLDEAAVLRGLEGVPWTNLAAAFAAGVEHYDPLRDVFDAVRRAGFDGDALAVVLRAYQDLLKNDWSGFGKPRGAAAKWESHGRALAPLDGRKLAPALIAWIRARQAVPGYYGLPRLESKWLWPLWYAWSDEHCPGLLKEVSQGRLDNGKSLSKTQKAARRECLEWFADRA
ncbi:hypothetical protein [Nannocystis punicea]|uniref:DUF4034 domain-containing protein n=1 Tax=Nannocystis punicea TaxID=2995304 RepID=A0ABY7HB51_9BACT|nr:hypothetical protein [Nannocystis poenicansa]WAS96473.1 hypothetical protein O0S08_09965 [Nannocystis poenicansa]